MSTWETAGDGIFVLREANCPIIHVAEGCGSACDYDQLLLEDLLKADIERKSHLASGDGACVYHVRSRPLTSSQ